MKKKKQLTAQKVFTNVYGSSISQYRYMSKHNGLLQIDHYKRRYHNHQRLRSSPTPNFKLNHILYYNIISKSCRIPWNQVIKLLSNTINLTMYFNSTIYEQIRKNNQYQLIITAVLQCNNQIMDTFQITKSLYNQDTNLDDSENDGDYYNIQQSDSQNQDIDINVANNMKYKISFRVDSHFKYNFRYLNHANNKLKVVYTFKINTFDIGYYEWNILNNNLSDLPCKLPSDISKDLTKNIKPDVSYDVRGTINVSSKLHQSIYILSDSLIHIEPKWLFTASSTKSLSYAIKYNQTEVHTLISKQSNNSNSSDKDPMPSTTDGLKASRECHICNRTFQTPGGFGSHMRACKQKPINNNNNKRKRKSESNPIMNQKRKKRKLNKYECKYCNLVFSSGNALGGHSSIHKNKKKETQLKGSMCGNINSNNNKKSYGNCCGITFNMQGTWDSHQRSHNMNINKVTKQYIYNHPLLIEYNDNDNNKSTICTKSDYKYKCVDCGKGFSADRKMFYLSHRRHCIQRINAIHNLKIKKQSISLFKPVNNINNINQRNQIKYRLLVVWRYDCCVNGYLNKYVPYNMECYYIECEMCGSKYYYLNNFIAHLNFQHDNQIFEIKINRKRTFMLIDISKSQDIQNKFEEIHQDYFYWNCIQTRNKYIKKYKKNIVNYKERDVKKMMINDIPIQYIPYQYTITPNNHDNHANNNQKPSCWLRLDNNTHSIHYTPKPKSFISPSSDMIEPNWRLHSHTFDNYKQHKYLECIPIKIKNKKKVSKSFLQISNKVFIEKELDIDSDIEADESFKIIEINRNIQSNQKIYYENTKYFMKMWNEYIMSLKPNDIFQSHHHYSYWIMPAVFIDFAIKYKYLIKTQNLRLEFQRHLETMYQFGIVEPKLIQDCLYVIDAFDQIN